MQLMKHGPSPRFKQPKPPKYTYIHLPLLANLVSFGPARPGEKAIVPTTAGEIGINPDAYEIAFPSSASELMKDPQFRN